MAAHSRTTGGKTIDHTGLGVEEILITAPSDLFNEASSIDNEQGDKEFTLLQIQFYYGGLRKRRIRRSELQKSLNTIRQVTMNAGHTLTVDHRRMHYTPLSLHGWIIV